MKPYVLILLAVVFSACSSESSREHLSCYVDKVIEENTGKEVIISHDDALEQGFVYDFNVDVNGTLIINGEEKYQEVHADKISPVGTHVYAIVQENGIDEDVVYVFDKEFSDVSFQMRKQKIRYEFSCKNGLFSNILESFSGEK